MQPVEQTDKEVTFTNQFLENDSEALEMDSEGEGLTDSDYVFLDQERWLEMVLPRALSFHH